jgi:transposase
MSDFSGHSRSPLRQYERWLLDLVAAEPDLTLKKIRTRHAREKKLKVGLTSIWRFFDRNEITFKKNRYRHRAGSPRRSGRTCPAQSRAAFS